MSPKRVKQFGNADVLASNSWVLSLQSARKEQNSRDSVLITFLKGTF